MDDQLETVCEYMRLNRQIKLTTVTQQLQVTRDRIQTQVEGGSGKRGPKAAIKKLLSAEESAICRYIDRLFKNKPSSTS